MREHKSLRQGYGRENKMMKQGNNIRLTLSSVEII